MKINYLDLVVSIPYGTIKSFSCIRYSDRKIRFNSLWYN